MNIYFHISTGKNEKPYGYAHFSHFLFVERERNQIHLLSYGEKMQRNIVAFEQMALLKAAQIAPLRGKEKLCQALKCMINAE